MSRRRKQKKVDKHAMPPARRSKVCDSCLGPDGFVRRGVHMVCRGCVKLGIIKLGAALLEAGRIREAVRVNGGWKRWKTSSSGRRGRQPMADRPTHTKEGIRIVYPDELLVDAWRCNYGHLNYGGDTCADCHRFNQVMRRLRESKS